MTKMKDWTGNSKTTFSIIGSSSHSDKDREVNDYYATDPKCADDLIKNVEVSDIWECACGEGHLAKVFDDYFLLKKSSDLIDRGYGEILDFLTHKGNYDGDIVTNPPYKYALEFAEKALEILNEGRYYCAFLKLTFLEGQARRKFFDKYPPKEILVYSQRQKCVKNGDFSDKSSSAISYCWFVWQKGFIGQPTIKWI